VQASTNRLVIIGLILAGVACIAISILYFSRSADALPAFVPGHEALVTRHHTKHGLAMLGLAAVCWVGAWMASGTGRTGSSR